MRFVARLRHRLAQGFAWMAGRRAGHTTLEARLRQQHDGTILGSQDPDRFLRERQERQRQAQQRRGW